MRAIVARDRAAGLHGLALGTWTDRAGRDRTPTIPGHEVSGVVAEPPSGPPGPG